MHSPKGLVLLCESKKALLTQARIFGTYSAGTMTSVQAVLELHADKERCFSSFFRILQKYGEQTSDDSKRALLQRVSEEFKIFVL